LHAILLLNVAKANVIADLGLKSVFTSSILLQYSTVQLTNSNVTGVS